MPFGVKTKNNNSKMVYGFVFVLCYDLNGPEIPPTLTSGEAGLVWRSSILTDTPSSSPLFTFIFVFYTCFQYLWIYLYVYLCINVHINVPMQASYIISALLHMQICFCIFMFTFTDTWGVYTAPLHAFTFTDAYGVRTAEKHIL